MLNNVVKCNAMSGWFLSDWHLDSYKKMPQICRSLSYQLYVIIVKLSFYIWFSTLEHWTKSKWVFTVLLPLCCCFCVTVFFWVSVPPYCMLPHLHSALCSPSFSPFIFSLIKLDAGNYAVSFTAIYFKITHTCFLLIHWLVLKSYFSICVPVGRCVLEGLCIAVF